MRGIEMTKKTEITWREYEIRKLMKQKGYKREDFPDDVSVRIAYKVMLDDDILELIWLIKRKNKKLRGDKPVLRAALKYYLNHIQDD